MIAIQITYSCNEANREEPHCKTKPPAYKPMRTNYVAEIIITSKHALSRLELRNYKTTDVLIEYLYKPQKKCRAFASNEQLCILRNKARMNKLLTS